MEPDKLTFDIPDNQQPDSLRRLVCWQWGNPDAARTVMCVHGLTRNARDFDFLARALSGNYRVLCPDMPGRGQAPWLKNPAGYNNPAYIADLIHMLRSLNIASVNWVGTSMGGILGMMAASAAPGLVRSLVLNDIGCFIPAAGLKRIAGFAHEKVAFSSRAEAEVAIHERWSTFGIRDEAHWQHMLTYGLAENGDGSFRFAYDPAIFAGFPKENGIADMDLWALWDAVMKIPVLLIRGATSDILTRATAHEMQSRHPKLTLQEIEGAGHAPALMEAGQVALVENWIKSN